MLNLKPVNLFHLIKGQIKEMLGIVQDIIMSSKYACIFACWSLQIIGLRLYERR